MFDKSYGFKTPSINVTSENHKTVKNCLPSMHPTSVVCGPAGLIDPEEIKCGIPSIETGQSSSERIGILTLSNVKFPISPDNHGAFYDTGNQTCLSCIQDLV